MICLLQVIHQVVTIFVEWWKFINYLGCPFHSLKKISTKPKDNVYEWTMVGRPLGASYLHTTQVNWSFPNYYACLAEHDEDYQVQLQDQEKREDFLGDFADAIVVELGSLISTGIFDVVPCSSVTCCSKAVCCLPEPVHKLSSSMDYQDEGDSSAYGVSYGPCFDNLCMISAEEDRTDPDESNGLAQCMPCGKAHDVPSCPFASAGAQYHNNYMYPATVKHAHHQLVPSKPDSYMCPPANKSTSYMKDAPDDPKPRVVDHRYVQQVIPNSNANPTKAPDITSLHGVSCEGFTDQNIKAMYQYVSYINSMPSASTTQDNSSGDDGSQSQPCQQTP